MWSDCFNLPQQSLRQCFQRAHRPRSQPHSITYNRTIHPPFHVASYLCDSSCSHVIWLLKLFTLRLYSPGLWHFISTQMLHRFLLLIWRFRVGNGRATLQESTTIFLLFFGFGLTTWTRQSFSGPYLFPHASWPGFLPSYFNTFILHIFCIIWSISEQSPFQYCVLSEPS